MNTFLKNTDLFIGFFGYELLNSLIKVKIPKQKNENPGNQTKKYKHVNRKMTRKRLQYNTTPRATEKKSCSM